MNVKGKIIVVTGAGSGIGRALVEKFIHQGAAQVVAVDMDAVSAEKTAKQFNCIAMSANVASEENMARVIEETEKNIGPIDLFCSNAGLSLAPSEQSPTSEWQTSRISM